MSNSPTIVKVLPLESANSDHHFDTNIIIIQSHHRNEHSKDQKANQEHPDDTCNEAHYT